jgi:hypothetical protein
MSERPDQPVAERRHQDRRAEDPRVNQLVTDMTHVKEELNKNTEITEQVRDLLASFRVMASVAKWITAVAAAIAGVLAAIKSGISFNDITPK